MKVDILLFGQISEIVGEQTIVMENINNKYIKQFIVSITLTGIKLFELNLF